MTRPRPAIPDPDIQAAWALVREQLDAAIRPYVQDHLVETIVRRFVADHLAGPGWRPPLDVPPPIIRDGRVARAMEGGGQT